MDNELPQNIAGRWQVVKELGSGAMGQVLLAKAEDGIPVAIKLMTMTLTKDQKQRVERFKSEFSILKELSHPGINKVYDFGYDEPTQHYYFTSEYIAGDPFLKATELLNVDEIEELFVEILRSLEYLHSHGIMHADIKSTNILVEANPQENSRIKLIDFGLAALGTFDKVVGTPSYMAPEVILRNKPDNRADLYSLGVLIYTAITRYNPFKARQLNEMFERQINVVPEPPSFYEPTVPKYLDDIIMKLLKKVPGERFSSAAHVIRALAYGSGKSYPVETQETFLGYLPTKGNIVGRKKELASIKEHCLAIKDLKPQTPAGLCLMGEAGTGKKRLLTELKYFAQLNELEVVELKVLDEKILAGFNEELKLLMKEPPKRSYIIVVGVLGWLATHKAGRQTIEQLRKLINWLGFVRALSPVKDVSRVLLAFSANQDELNLFSYMLDLPENELNIVELKNFDQQETKEYLTVLTGVEEVPQELVAELYKRTQGNPLFITEVMKELVKQGMLFDKIGRWNKEAIEDIGISFAKLKVPQTLTQMLVSAYAATLPAEKEILEALAVWNRPVSAEELKAIASSEKIFEVLSSLVKTNTVFFDNINGAYYFQNDLLKDVVYENISKEKKADLHQLITSFLKTHQPENFSEINWHLGRCAEDQEAVDALIRLGLHYLKNYKVLDSITNFSEALARGQVADYRLNEILLHLGEAYTQARRYVQAIEVYQKLLDKLKSQGDEESLEVIETWQKLGVVYLRYGDLGHSKEILGKAQKALEKISGKLPLKLKVSNHLARLAFLEGKLDLAANIYKENKDRWKVLSPDEKKQVLNNDLAHVYLRMNKFDLAEKELNADIKYLESIKEDKELERAYYGIAELYREKGDLDQAILYFEKAISLAKNIYDSELLLYTYNGLGNAYNAKGEQAKSLYWYERGLDLAARTGEDSNAAAISVNIGLIKETQNDLEQAAHHFDSAIRIINRVEKKTSFELGYLLRAYIELANIYRLQKKYKKAQYFLNEAQNYSGLAVFKTQLFWFKKIELELARDKNDQTRVEQILAELKNLADSDQEKKIYEELSYVPSAEPEVQKGGESKEASAYEYILEINKFLGTEDDLDFVLKSILKYALELAQAEAGLILLKNQEEELEVKARVNIKLDQKISEISTNIARSCLEQDRVIVTQNAITDDRFKKMESVVLLGLKSVLCVPIHIRKKPAGVLYLENRSKIAAFVKVNEEILRAFADQAGIAIENAKLLESYQSEEKLIREQLAQSQAKLEELDEQVKLQVSELQARYQFDRLASISPKMKDIFELLEKISDTALSVCLTGESGTGKELVAKAIHYNSSQAKGPFVAVNCTAIPATLIESELFGYKAGAFTGATKDKKGLFEAADKGTLFLDEIADLDPFLQAKLLRAIQEHEIRRVGDTKPIKCKVRILCATNKNLEKLVEEQKFRQDLYYRLAEIKVELVPLRQRIEDIPFLIDEFVVKYAQEHNFKTQPKVDPGFVKACLEYAWPGNIRELENAVRVATALSGQKKISLENLPENHFLRQAAGHTKLIKQEQIARADLPLIDSYNHHDPTRTWKEYEDIIIAAAFKQSNFGVKQTAKVLGLAVPTIYKKINELNLKDEANSLYAADFQYDENYSLDDYVLAIFKATWEYVEHHPYQAAKQLGISHGYFYKILKQIRN
ncbi:MAG: sigma 54-interacting transcriptional regulator [Pseudomonadota bacterium]